MLIDVASRFFRDSSGIDVRMKLYEEYGKVVRGPLGGLGIPDFNVLIKVRRIKTKKAATLVHVQP